MTGLDGASYALKLVIALLCAVFVYDKFGFAASFFAWAVLSALTDIWARLAMIHERMK